MFTFAYLSAQAAVSSVSVQELEFELNLSDSGLEAKTATGVKL